MRAYSERYEAALALAACAHKDQLRKVGEVPYLVHLVHVSVILLRYGFAEDVALAGLLHDAVEDQDVPLADIEAQFGSTVAEMVAALTEWKRDGQVERPWEIRKRELFDRIRQASPDAVAVKAADALHNARSLAQALRREGAALWDRFSRGPEPSLWYYQSVASLVRERLGMHPLVAELEEAVRDLEQAIG